MIVIAYNRKLEKNVRFNNVIKIYLLYDLITIICSFNGIRKYDLPVHEYYVKLILEKE